MATVYIPAWGRLRKEDYQLDNPIDYELPQLDDPQTLKSNMKGKKNS